MTKPAGKVSKNLAYRTIKLKDETYNALCGCGRFGDSMDDIVTRLLVEHNTK